MSWHLPSRRWAYRSHVWVGRVGWRHYALIQWWPTEGSWPGVGLVWGSRSFAIGLRKRVPA